MLVKVLTDKKTKVGSLMNISIKRFITALVICLSLVARAGDTLPVVGEVNNPNPPIALDENDFGFNSRPFGLGTADSIRFQFKSVFLGVSMIEGVESDRYFELQPQERMLTDTPIGQFNPMKRFGDFNTTGSLNCIGLDPDYSTVTPRFNDNTASVDQILGFMGMSGLPDECPNPGTVNINSTCSCVRAKNYDNRPERLLFRNMRDPETYRPMTPENARSMCQQVVNTGIVNNFSALIQNYSHSAVVGELLKISGFNDVECSAESMGSQFTDTYSRDDSGNGRRKCSVQAVGYVVNQLEKTAQSCVSGDNVTSNCPLASTMVKSLAPSVTSERSQEFEELLSMTRNLPGDDADESNSARVALRAKYDEYVNKSNIGVSLQSMIEDEVSSVVNTAFDCTSEEGANCPEPTSFVDKKRRSAMALINYISSIQDPSSKNAFAQMYPAVDVPSMERVLSGSVVLTDEQVDTILRDFNQRVASQCVSSKAELLTSCKQVSSGTLFDLENSTRAACEDPTMMNQRIIGNHLRLNTWNQILSQQYSRADRAATQQFMCAAHFNFYGLSQNANAACEERSEDGVFDQIKDEYKDPEYRNNALLGLEFGADHSYTEINAAFNNCNPFAPVANPAQQRNLNDEENPYDQANPTIAASQAQAEQTRETQGLSFGDGIRSGSNNSGGDANVAGGGNGLDDITERTRREFSNQSPSAVSSEASNFYNSMDSRRIEEMTSSFVSQYASSSNDEPSRSPSSITSDNAQEELVDAREALGANDELLAQLADLERRNRELNQRLNSMNVTEIQDEEGNTVSVADAFNKTNERIAQQRAKAMEERQKIEQREREAQAIINQSRSNTGFTATPSNAGGTRNLGENGGGTQRSVGGASSTGASIIPSNSGSSITPSSGSTSVGSNSGGDMSYGPSQFSGIVLSADALSIAKPQLDLGGRSLQDSSDLIRAAITAVKSELETRNSSLPAYNIGGKSITEYIVQEQDGKNVIVYLDGDEVKVQEVDLSLEATQAVVEIEQEIEEIEAVVEPTPARAPAAESEGRKGPLWEEVENLLDSAE